MEELAVPQRLGDAVREVEPGHLLVADLGVQADEVGALEAVDERQGVADGRQQDVAARLVRLRLDREADRVVLLGDVLAEQVKGLLQAVERDPHVLGRTGLRAFAPAPGDVHLGAEVDGEVDVADGLAQRVAAHVPVVRGKRAVLEHRVGEQVRGGHRHAQPGLGQRRAEAADPRGPFGLGGTERDQVVVVEGDAVRAKLGEPVHGLDRVEGAPGGVAERVATRPADRPQAEGELVGGAWREWVHRGAWREWVHRGAWREWVQGNAPGFGAWTGALVGHKLLINAKNKLVSRRGFWEAG